MSERSHLAPLINALAGRKVACIGDIMLDRFVSGEVARISPEAPIPVLRIRHETAMLGGAGNVIRNLDSLGAAALFVGVVGDDEAAGTVGKLIGELSHAKADLITQPGRCTSIKTRFLAGGQQMLRTDHEDTSELAQATRTALLSAAKSAIEAADIVVLSDYGKGVLTGGLAAQFIALAASAGKPVIVDPKGTDFTIYRGADLLTPNRKELAEASRLPVDGDEAVIAAARHLIATCGLKGLLVTRSQDGMTLVPADGAISHLPAEAREVFDVSGAGDTVVATLAAAWASGAALDQAAMLANVAAGIVVGKVGTAVTDPDELSDALHHQDLMRADAKVAARDKAAERAEAWRRQGLKVGFTNGCFDLLHPGHISLLGQARAACDRLVVGLNSDASVQRLKGPTRPVQAETARAAVLSALAMVDLVVIFDEDTPLDLIAALRPDVLVKGADYTVETVVGADLVQGYGGKVFLARLEDGFSTTSTIARMNR